LTTQQSIVDRVLEQRADGGYICVVEFDAEDHLGRQRSA